MQVREIMTPNPACCTPDSTLRDVAGMMERNDCGLIPVVSSLSDMKPVGTVTDRDITIRTVAANHNPINMKAADIMTPNVSTVKPDMTLEECLSVMENNEIRRVLVVDDQGKCCGIVAQADIVQSTANPIRTNEVIREISESSPSPNQRIQPGRRFADSHSRYSSYMGSSYMPLLIGLGSGAALMYLLSNRQSSSGRRNHSDIDVSYEHENRLNLTNQENFGKYADAEQEVEKRRQELGDRVQTLKSELGSPRTGNVTSMNKKDDTQINNKERSAGQGS